VSKAKTNLDEPEDVAAEGPEGPNYQEHVALVPASKLLELLSQIAPGEPTPPLSADEFRLVLTTVNSLGWTWTTDNPPALKPKLRDGKEPEYPNDLVEKYPRFPQELGAIIRFVLLGWRPRGQLGSAGELVAKAAAVSEIVLTDEYRSAFFFDHATKGKRFYDLDWEVIVKAAERNVLHSPTSIYALISVETAERQPGFDERRESHCFAADERALQRMIDILHDALDSVKETQTQQARMRERNVSGGHDA
jgi:hypothetical protein